MTIKNYDELMNLLDQENVSRSPVYTGYGLEVYQNNEIQTQIIVNFRGDEKEVTINKGY